MIKRVWVDMLSSQGAIVYWELGNGPAPATIEVQCARNAEDDQWDSLHVANADEWYWHDPQQRAFGPRMDIWYRTVVTYVTGEVERSPGVNGYGGMPKRDWLVARQMIFDAMTQFVKGNGHRGLLCKRKHWGEPCPSCLDHDQQKPARPDCAICHGTGKKDGYYPGVPCWAQVGEYAKKLNLNGEGIAEKVTTQAKFVALPEPEAFDIWIDLATGIRYQIGVNAEDGNAVQMASNVRGRAIIVVAQLSPISPTDTTSEIPVVNSPSAGPYRPTSQTGDPLAGLPAPKEVNPYANY